MPDDKLKSNICVESSGLGETLARLTSMLDDENDDEDGYFFRLNQRAYKNAYEWIVETHKQLGENFIKPYLVSDNNSGVDVKWIKEGRIVEMVFHSSSKRRDYIYYQNNETYGHTGISKSNLKERLNLLRRSSAF